MNMNPVRAQQLLKLKSKLKLRQKRDLLFVILLTPFIKRYYVGKTKMCLK